MSTILLLITLAVERANRPPETPLPPEPPTPPPVSEPPTTL
ncbi:hypothetical protein [Limnoglobus roseus]|nr:hypothetical protein [Limnoglobus roseus]